MKIYETKTAPNPRRVRMFLAEKGIDVDYVQVDIQKGENLSPQMRAKNPLGKIPILELDDGTCIAETDAICTYFEAIQPEPPLMGTTPIEKATISMWQRQVEFAFMMQVGMCFQHTTGYFKDRMTPVPEFGKEAGINAAKYLNILERRLGEKEFIAGNAFSIADITALCAMDFARVVKIRMTDEHVNLARWYEAVSNRASAKA
ncbi:glutathione S-transferase [Alteromonas macleodii str. 'Black Sea 11']|uniref:glutathione S-transferase family protein n=1 Tax=Alteromonas abrolhosensis TaxID=1892904 RepID=UPI000286F1BA|nr:glutathione S-transferase [Alteromonas macleodii str. 'Black Sea 11']NKW89344.1 glutathione S-transferase family protein [Alteromonadaceae bacterium A_SAG4]NKX35375.1 glutathione S-transferase family protein [Alteromonadaceae bacterium A_SAG3]NKX69227.1 glutathione S-transferase family protein [Alteromonadaceae bacterium A_SAG7]